MSYSQQIHVRIVGTVGGVVGLVLALASLLYKRMWGFSIFVFFVIIIQIVSYVGLKQQYKQTVEIMEEAQAMENDVVSPKIDAELGNDRYEK